MKTCISYRCGLWLTGAILVGSIAPLSEWAQAVENPAFEVSTVKPGNPNARNSSLDLGMDRVTSNNLPLTFILQFAYNLNTGSKDQIVGAPSWVDTTLFDIDAKEDPEVAAKIAKMPQEQRVEALRQMVQALLSDRFQLKVHHETRELPVLALVVAKGGPKLTPAVKPIPADGVAPASTGSWSGLHNPGRGKTEGRDIPVKLLVDALSSKPEIGGRIVVDATGLQGNYNFVLTWTPDNRSASGGDSDSGGPSLFAALQEQLGLKLEPRKAPIDCIVVDRVEQPSPN